MMHQLHCLRALNLAFDGSPIVTDEHLQHCLNYIRQAVLCGADLTLESGDFAKRDFDEQRAGETHTCRDWSVVYRVMKENLENWNASSGSVASHIEKRHGASTHCVWRPACSLICLIGDRELLSNQTCK